jgi:7-cyano-7-deazaguanine synthase
MLKKAVVVLSGGLDSVTLMYHLHAKGYALTAVSFNYGQKHLKELESAATIVQKLGAAHHIIDLTFIRDSILSSSLVNQDIQNPKEKYSKENMLITVVPNRNTMMLSLAWTIACSINADVLAYAPHKGDSYIYADCREDYVTAMNLALRLGSADSRLDNLELIAPFLRMSKAEIVKHGEELGVPFASTWSCYDGKELHCGKCGTCHQRKNAFIDSGVADPTIYQE